MSYTIELDCPPGAIRPGNLLPSVIDGFDLGIDPDKPNGTLFGNWTWVIPDDKAENYVGCRDEVKARITALYYSGQIRYGSW